MDWILEPYWSPKRAIEYQGDDIKLGCNWNMFLLACQ